MVWAGGNEAELEIEATAIRDRTRYLVRFHKEIIAGREFAYGVIFRAELDRAAEVIRRGKALFSEEESVAILSLLKSFLGARTSLIESISSYGMADRVELMAITSIARELALGRSFAEAAQKVGVVSGDEAEILSFSKDGLEIKRTLEVLLLSREEEFRLERGLRDESTYPLVLVVSSIAAISISWFAMAEMSGNTAESASKIFTFLPLLSVAVVSPIGKLLSNTTERLSRLDQIRKTFKTVSRLFLGISAGIPLRATINSIARKRSLLEYLELLGATTDYCDAEYAVRLLLKDWRLGSLFAEKIAASKTQKQLIASVRWGIGSAKEEYRRATRKAATVGKLLWGGIAAVVIVFSLVLTELWLGGLSGVDKMLLLG